MNNNTISVTIHHGSIQIEYNASWFTYDVAGERQSVLTVRTRKQDLRQLGGGIKKELSSSTHDPKKVTRRAKALERLARHLLRIFQRNSDEYHCGSIGPSVSHEQDDGHTFEVTYGNDAGVSVYMRIETAEANQLANVAAVEEIIRYPRLWAA